MSCPACDPSTRGNQLRRATIAPLSKKATVGPRCRPPTAPRTRPPRRAKRIRPVSDPNGGSVRSRGVARQVRTAYLRRVGGFDQRLTGPEDAALRNRMLADGVALAWADTQIVHHEGRLGLAGVMRKRFYYGRTVPSYRRAHPGAVSSQAGATLRALWRHRRLLAADPAHAAGLVVLRACEV